MKLKLLLIIIVSLGFLGCMELETDPFAGYDENVRNGRLPGQKGKGIGKDSIVIDAQKIYDFVEDEEQTIKFGYRVLIKNTRVTAFFIENLDEVLPDSKFIAETGELTWKPPQDFVKGDDTVGAIAINVVLALEAPTGAYEVRTPIFINVYRDRNRPEVMGLKNLPKEVTEGDSVKFEFTVKDKDSLGKTRNQDKEPSIVILSNSHYKSAAPFLKQYNKSQDSRDRTLWKFYYELDLTGIDITKDETFGFGIIASSRLNETSNILNGSFKALAHVRPPETSWVQIVNFARDQYNNHIFIVSDPDLSTLLRVDFLSGCDADTGLECRCRAISSGKQQCTIRGILNQKRRFKIDYKVMSRRSSGKKVEKTFSGWIQPIEPSR